MVPNEQINKGLAQAQRTLDVITEWQACLETCESLLSVLVNNSPRLFFVIYLNAMMAFANATVHRIQYRQQQQQRERRRRRRRRWRQKRRHRLQKRDKVNDIAVQTFAVSRRLLRSKIFARVLPDDVGQLRN